MSAGADLSTHLPDRMPPRPPQRCGVEWTGILAPINVPYLGADGLPVVLRHGRGAELRARPVPLIYPDGGGERVGVVTAVRIGPAGAGIGLHADGTATGTLADLLAIGARVHVVAHVAGPVSLTGAAGDVPVIELDTWRLSQVVVSDRPRPGAFRIWSATEPGTSDHQGATE